jgi:predicted Zn-ribbon and HTH transcriptional regulator
MSSQIEKRAASLFKRIASFKKTIDRCEKEINRLQSRCEHRQFKNETMSRCPECRSTRIKLIMRKQIKAKAV